MTKISLRDYQQDIIKQTINSSKSTLMQIPTGGGKTLIAKEIAKYLSNNLNQQVLFVAPKIVLMEQTAKVFRELNPHIIHKNNPYDKKHKILVSTIQTASRRDINPDVLIIDEIHHGFKGKMIQALMQKPNTRVIGLSATPYDEDGNMLKGFELILDQYDIKYMVENNYLTTVKPFELIKIRKLESVKIINGDYDVQELSKIMCNNQTVLEIVGSTVEYIVNYKKTIVFAVDIGHAELLAEAYKKEGFSAKAIHSKLNAEDNAQDIEKFKNGEIQILISVLMLTTGFDVPDVEVAVLARPTKSKNLYRQMVGRVLRKAENKTHAILLDCGNVIENLGMPLEDIEAIKKQETRNSKQKCENCESENLKLKHKDDKSFWECGDCGHVRSIEHGTYECKSCHKLYAYSKDRFSIKSNKLYLNCDNCPYPTFISEYTGSEIFVEVTDKTEEKIDSNKSLVKILEEKKRKEEQEKEEARIMLQREKFSDELNRLIAKIEYTQKIEQLQKSIKTKSLKQIAEERFEKEEKFQKDKKNIENLRKSREKKEKKT